MIEEGDIITSSAPTGRAITVSDKTQLWPAGIVPYTIDPALPDSSVRAVLTAIELWNEVGGISLLPVAQVRDISPDLVRDTVRFVDGDHCASWVGRRGGSQDVWIASYCPAGSVMHEIGHLLGLEHEHTRPDRDQYIQIHWDNIEQDKRHNFDIAPAGSLMPGGYDYDSIMHYGSHNFSSNGLATISAIDGSARRIGQRIAPSEGDLLAIAQLYGSDLSITSRIVDAARGKQLDIYVSNESLQAAHAISVAIGIVPDQQLPGFSQDAWTCKAASEDLELICELALLPASAVQPLTLGLPEIQGLEGIDVTLTSNTPDLDLSNNSSGVLGDEERELPELRPVPEPASVMNDKAVLQQDAVAHVAVSGGALSLHAILLLLLWLVRQACSRINFTTHGHLLGIHRRYLLGR